MTQAGLGTAAGAIATGVREPGGLADRLASLRASRSDEPVPAPSATVDDLHARLGELTNVQRDKLQDVLARLTAATEHLGSLSGRLDDLDGTLGQRLEQLESNQRALEDEVGRLPVTVAAQGESEREADRAEAAERWAALLGSPALTSQGDDVRAAVADLAAAHAVATDTLASALADALAGVTDVRTALDLSASEAAARHTDLLAAAPSFDGLQASLDDSRAGIVALHEAVTRTNDETAGTRALIETGLTGLRGDTDLLAASLAEVLASLGSLGAAQADVAAQQVTFGVELAAVGELQATLLEQQAGVVAQLAVLAGAQAGLGEQQAVLTERQVGFGEQQAAAAAQQAVLAQLQSNELEQLRNDVAAALLEQADSAAEAERRLAERIDEAAVAVVQALLGS